MNENTTMSRTSAVLALVNCDLCFKASWLCNRTRITFESGRSRLWTVCEDCS